MKTEEIKEKLAFIESQMARPDFWNDKNEAQKTIAKYQELKDELAGVGKYDKSESIITILAGAGGADAEDFAKMLLEMYVKYCESRNWSTILLHDNQNDQGGFRNVTIEVAAKSFGELQYESGVHRLVRISPFNAQSKRHTAFAMVEVTPKLKELSEFELDDTDLEVEFSKSSGPGGQNVNKRETAVRIKHIPTDISVHVSSERTQDANRQKAMELLRGRIYKRLEEERSEREGNFKIAKTTANEWGSQIRSYVLHPYQLVKDHRSDFEVPNVDKVFDGEIQELIQSVKEL
jgi:peptide chain release factor 2